MFIVSGFLFIALTFVPDRESKHPYIVQISFILVSCIFLLIGFICWFGLFRKQTTTTDTTATDTAIDTTAMNTTAMDTTEMDTTSIDTAEIV